MKNLTFLLLVSIIVNLNLLSVNAQNSNQNLFIGYSASLSDKRSDFLSDEYGPRVRKDKDLLEHDFFIHYRTKMWTAEKWKIHGGLGYLVNLNTIALPISRDFFKTIWLPWVNGAYYKHSASLSLDLNYLATEWQNFNIKFNQGIYSNFSFFKSATERNNGATFVYWGLEPSEIEWYSGIQVDFSRTVLILQFRHFQMSFRDDALANNGKDIDFNNPLKLRISLGRVF